LNALFYRYRALPRSGRWLIIFGLFVVAYFAVLEPVMERTGHYKSQADGLARSLGEKAQIRGKIADNAGVIEQLTGLFGRPTPPADRSRRSSALEKRINTIFSEHQVSNQRTTYREPVALTTEAPRALAGPKDRLERLAAELTFETDIPTLMAILTQLEQSPEVSGVTKISIRKVAPSGRSREKDGPVQVNLTAETWIVTPASTSRPSRGGES
jgi:hypothetical protein